MEQIGAHCGLLYISLESCNTQGFTQQARFSFLRLETFGQEMDCQSRRWVRLLSVPP